MKYFKTECKNLFLSPKRLFYVLVFPLVIFGFFAAIFYKGVPRDLPMAYINYDQSQLSENLLRMLDATPNIDLKIKLTDEQEAQRLIQQQQIMGFIVIPVDFQQKLFKGENQSVICYTNNQFMLGAGLIQKDFQTTVGMFSAGLVMKKKMQKGQQTQKVHAEAQTVKVDDHGLFNPYANYAYYLLTALLPMMLQMIVMMVTVYVLGIEFRYRRGKQWLKKAGGNPLKALIGKLLPYTLVLLFVAWWMNYLLFGLIGAPLHIPMFNVVLITFALAIAFSFAAYTFPMEGLPKSMQYLAQIFPYAHFMKYYVNRAIKGIPVEMTWQPLLALLLFGLLLIVAYPMFVKKIKSGGYETI